MVQIWPQVKAANPHLSSVTEIGAVVGAMWRDLDPVEKQRYNDQFNKEKVTSRNGVDFSSCVSRGTLHCQSYSQISWKRWCQFVSDFVHNSRSAQPSIRLG